MLTLNTHTLQRRGVVSIPNRTTIITVVSWVLQALVISTLIARFAVKLSRRTTRTLMVQEDVLLALAALFSFGQTIAISIQWKDNTSERHLQSFYDNPVYQKTAYVSSMLFIANMGCAKICISLVMQKLFAGRLFKYTSTILAIFTGGWMVIAIMVTAFQCHIPTPWNVLSNKCINIVAFDNYVASTNIATEIPLVLVPLAIWTQDTSFGNRVYVSVVFWSRLSVVAAVIIQLYFINASVDFPPIPESCAISLCMQIAQTLSVISACLPGLYPLIAKDKSDNPSTHIETDGHRSRWDAEKFGSLSYSHVSGRSIDLHNRDEPVISPCCRPLATHGLVRLSASCDSYSFPRIPANIALPLSTPKPPVNVFNRLIRSSSSLDLDPFGTPRNSEGLGCLPAPDWEDEEVEVVEENAEPGRVSPERRPTSEYIFQRSKIISVPEERNMFEVGGEWNGFVPPLPTPKLLENPPRAF